MHLESAALLLRRKLDHESSEKCSRECRKVARSLKSYKVLVDSGWFLDIPNFSGSGGFTFQNAAKNLKKYWNASYDRQVKFLPVDCPQRMNLLCSMLQTYLVERLWE